MANWKGTPVPNSGTVDKLYLNDKVSFQEIYNLLSSIEYAPYDDNGFFEIYIALNCDGGSMFGILKKNNTDTPRGIEYDINVDGNTVWTSVNDEGFTSYGLNVLATQQNYGYIPNTGEALDNGSIGTKVYEVGLQNDKISSLFSITPFEEEVTLDSWAEDIANAIREKKGIEKEEKWVGTAVPNSGLVENVYVNTNLSKEEVFTMLEPLLVEIYEAVGGYENYVYVNADMDKVLSYVADTAENDKITKLSINYLINGTTTTIFDSDNGFSSDFNGVVEINDENSYGGLIEQAGLSPSNDKLSSLFSTTPFEEVQEVTLDSWAEDIADAIREKKSTTNKIPRLNFAQEIRSIETGGELLEPTAVPISGMVEKVYFNFNVDVSKIINIIKNLTFLEVPSVGEVYPIVSNDDMSKGLVIQKISDETYILTNGEGILARITCSTTEPEFMFALADNEDSNHLQTDFSQPIEFGFENMVGVLGSQFPDYVNSNELLKEMISITPIQKIEGGGATEETFVRLAFKFYGFNINVGSGGTFQNPDNIPIYKVTLNATTFQVTSVEPYTGNIVLKYPTNYEYKYIRDFKISVETPSDECILCVKLKDVYNKQVPYVEGTELSQYDTSKEAVFSISDWAPVGISSIKLEGNDSGTVGRIEVSDSHPINTTSKIPISGTERWTFIN